MAKHRKKKTKHHRVSSLSLTKHRTPIMIGSALLGYFVLGDTINTQIDKMLPAPSATPSTGMSLSSILPVAAEAGIGTVLVSMKKTGTIGAVAGGVLLGAGIRRALKQAGVIKGYQSVPVIGARNRRMAGYQSVPVIGGVPSVLQGMPAQLSSAGGYRVNGADGYIPSGSGITG